MSVGVGGAASKSAREAAQRPERGIAQGPGARRGSLRRRLGRMSQPGRATATLQTHQRTPSPSRRRAPRRRRRRRATQRGLCVAAAAVAWGGLKCKSSPPSASRYLPQLLTTRAQRSRGCEGDDAGDADASSTNLARKPDRPQGRICGGARACDRQVGRSIRLPLIWGGEGKGKGGELFAIDAGGDGRTRGVKGI